MNFKEFIKIDEALPMIDNGLIQFCLKGFEFITQTHIYHLLTKSHSEHISIGEFYESLNTLIDNLAETCIGLNVNNSIESTESTILFTYTKDILLNQLDEFRQYVTSYIYTTDNAELSSINDILINIQKTIDTLLYKLQQD